jgi:hypothetical protein
VGHRGLAATASTLLLVAIAPAAARATTGVGWAPGEPSPAASGRGFGPTHDAGPSGPSALAPPAPPGGAGIGDPYFPLEGNGGYDVRHYDLTFSYDPATDRLDAVNQIRAVTTETLSRFDLDLQQLDVSAATVNGEPATFTRDGQELQITPKKSSPPRSASTSASATAASRRRSSARRSSSARPTASSTPTTGPSWATSPTRPRRGSP